MPCPPNTNTPTVFCEVASMCAVGHITRNFPSSFSKKRFSFGNLRAKMVMTWYFSSPAESRKGTVKTHQITRHKNAMERNNSRKQKATIEAVTCMKTHTNREISKGIFSRQSFNKRRWSKGDENEHETSILRLGKTIRQSQGIPCEKKAHMGRGRERR